MGTRRKGNSYSRSLAPSTHALKAVATSQARPFTGSLNRFFAIQQQRCAFAADAHLARFQVRKSRYLESQAFPITMGEKRNSDLVQVTIRGSVGSDAHPYENT